MPNRLPSVLLLSIALAACAEPSSPTRMPSDGEALFGKAPADPTATVKLPLADAGLSVRSDGLFNDGTYSSYANGVCGVTGTIFLGGSGDAVIDGSIPNAPDRQCVHYPRKATVVYPDGVSETISGPLFSVRVLQNATTRIPVGSTAKRWFHVRTSSARCDGVHWGGAVGGDSVLVTRTSANSWHVQTQPAPNDRAACKRTTGNTLLGSMPVDLWVVASRDLP